MKKRVILLLLVVTLTYNLPVAQGRTTTTITDINQDGNIPNTWTRYNATTPLEIDSRGLGQDNRSYIEFNLSQVLPAGAIVDSVSLKYRVQTVSNPGTDDIYFEYMSTQPSTLADNVANNKAIFWDIGNGTYANTQNVANGVWYTQDLGVNAAANATSHPSWFAVGITCSAQNGYIYSSESASPPVLLVDWHLATDYTYVFTGPYYENGTRAAADTIDAIISTGNEEVEVNGTTTGYYPTMPTLFSWQIGTSSRHFYVFESENITVTTIDNSTYNVYGFDVRDYSGRIGDSDSYLEALREINGSLTLVQRELIWNTQTSTPLVLEENQIYFLRIRLPSGSYYDIGYFTPSDEAPPTLIVKGIDFDDQYQPISGYVNITIDRPNGTHIRFLYNESLTTYPTVNVTWSIEYRNGTVVHQNHTVGENTGMHWFNAVNTTTYRVTVGIVHGYYGYINETVILDGLWNPQDAPDFSPIGLPSNLFSVLIVMIFLGGVSRFSASLGVFTATVVGMGLDAWGWWTMPVEVQAAGLIIAVFMKITGRG